jgi:uncharacterized protein
MSYIKRELEKTIIETAQSFSVVALTGPRQCGKSTTLKRIFSDKYRYFTLDDPVIRASAIKDPKAFIESIEDYCIIDEAQYSPELFSCVKMAVDNNRSKKGMFILSGSQQFLLMKSITESLAGRVGILNMLPFSMDEMHRAGTEAGAACYYAACARGSYPEPFIERKTKIQRWYESYVQSYVQRDVRSLYNVGKLKEFRAFIKILAAQAGQILNLSRISAAIGVAVNTLKSWISILEAGGIVYILNPYFVNITKRLVKNPKIYFVDNGLLCNQLGISTAESLRKSLMAGLIFENYCIMETVKFFRNRGLFEKLYFLRDNSGMEIDLLIESGQKLHPVEIKLSVKKAQEAGAVMEKFFHEYKAVPADRGLVLTLDGKSKNSGPLVSNVGIENYTAALEAIIE